MFNVTIIKLKDILKYIAIIIVVYFFSKFIIKYSSNTIDLRHEMSFNWNDFLLLGINSESTVIKNISKQEKQKEKTEAEEDFVSNLGKRILQIGSNAFKISELGHELGQDKNDALVENIDVASQEELTTSQTIEELKVASTQVVTPNPIKETYNKEYNGIKIKNETDFELTDDLLNSDNLSINTNNVIIFHTHTCESYTQSEKYQYEESRKF